MGLGAAGRHRAGRPARAPRARTGDGTAAAETARPGRARGGLPAAIEWAVLAAAVLLAAMLVRTFLVAPFYIPSESMEDTLKVGDRVLVDRLSYHLHPIRRGDIVVFNGLDSFTPEVTTTEPRNPLARVARSVGAAIGIAPPGERDFIKRVIGVPGDRVACAGDGQPITVNGVPLDESSYLYPGDTPSVSRFDVTVPKGRLWVMGDHRSLSADSRSHLGDPGGGTVPQDKVIGRAFAVVWPIRDARGLGTPRTFDQHGLQAQGAAPVYGGQGAAPVYGLAALPLLAAGPALRAPRRGRP